MHQHKCLDSMRVVLHIFTNTSPPALHLFTHTFPPASHIFIHTFPTLAWRACAWHYGERCSTCVMTSSAAFRISNSTFGALLFTPDFLCLPMSASICFCLPLVCIYMPMSASVCLYLAQTVSICLLPASVSHLSATVCFQFYFLCLSRACPSFDCSVLSPHTCAVSASQMFYNLCSLMHNSTLLTM
jgi:hypothetical protein